MYTSGWPSRQTLAQHAPLCRSPPLSRLYCPCADGRRAERRHSVALPNWLYRTSNWLYLIDDEAHSSSDPSAMGLPVRCACACSAVICTLTIFFSLNVLLGAVM